MSLFGAKLHVRKVMHLTSAMVTQYTCRQQVCFLFNLHDGITGESILKFVVPATHMVILSSLLYSFWLILLYLIR